MRYGSRTQTNASSSGVGSFSKYKLKNHLLARPQLRSELVAAPTGTTTRDTQCALPPSPRLEIAQGTSYIL